MVVPDLEYWHILSESQISTQQFRSPCDRMKFIYSWTGLSILPFLWEVQGRSLFSMPGALRSSKFFSSCLFLWVLHCPAPGSLYSTGGPRDYTWGGDGQNRPRVYTCVWVPQQTAACGSPNKRVRIEMSIWADVFSVFIIQFREMEWLSSCRSFSESFRFNREGSGRYVPKRGMRRRFRALARNWRCPLVLHWEDFATAGMRAGIANGDAMQRRPELFYPRRRLARNQLTASDLRIREATSVRAGFGARTCHSLTARPWTRDPFP